MTPEQIAAVEAVKRARADYMAERITLEAMHRELRTHIGVLLSTIESLQGEANRADLARGECECECQKLRAKTESLQADGQDAKRWRAWLPYLSVVYSEGSAWTCWTEMACIPFRAKDADPNTLADKMVEIATERAAIGEQG